MTAGYCVIPLVGTFYACAYLIPMPYVYILYDVCLCGWGCIFPEFLLWGGLDCMGCWNYWLVSWTCFLCFSNVVLVYILRLNDDLHHYRPAHL